MLKTSPISIFLQLLINTAGNNKTDGNEKDGNKTNLLNLSASKKSIKAGYLTSKGTKKSGGNPNSNGSNTKKGIKTTKSFNYLTPDAKKVFNLLRHMFTQAPIFQ